jgi:MFS family permease
MADRAETKDGGDTTAFTGHVRSRARGTLATCGVAHFVHDGFSDSLYVLLPLWAEAFGLNHAQVGLLKTLYSSAMAAFQLPAGLLAERLGQRGLLVAGTILAGVAVTLFGVAGGFIGLLVFVSLSGSASGVQHPLSSSLVATAYAAGPRRAALGTYNFTGDLGKVAFPLAVAAVAAVAGWREASFVIGGVGILAGVGVFFALRRFGAGAKPSATSAESVALEVAGWRIRDKRGFGLLAAISTQDSLVRTGFLTFLPFLLIGKGAEVGTVGFALALVFAGGATGKLLCGHLAERVGIIRTVVLTEIMTGLGILCLLVLPLTAALILLPLVGLALNGTSSVLYGTVPEFVDSQRQSRAFGLFYTLAIGASAVSPLLSGILSDAAGLAVTLSVLAVIALAVVPLAFALAAPIAAARAAASLQD